MTNHVHLLKELEEEQREEHLLKKNFTKKKKKKKKEEELAEEVLKAFQNAAAIFEVDLV